MRQDSLRTDEWMEAVIRRYADMVYQLALARLKNAADAEDVFQEVFCRLARSGAPFQSEEHLKAWLLKVTVNCCKKLWASAWIRRTRPFEEAERPVEPEAGGGEDVLQAVAALPPKYRTVIHLFYYEDLSVAQISEALGIGPSTVTSQLSRARALLKKKLKGEYDYGNLL